MNACLLNERALWIYLYFVENSLVRALHMLHECLLEISNPAGVDFVQETSKTIADDSHLNKCS